jgi:DNA mismatch repair ATPase MutS
LLSIQSLNNSFEIDRNDLTAEEIEKRITEIEELASGLINSEPLMKFWIIYSRYKKEVPSLKDVKKQVKNWLEKVKRQKRTSPMAQFYKYVRIQISLY